IEPPLCRVDDDGAWRIPAVITHGGAAEVRPIESKNIVGALLACAATQQLGVGLGLRETDGTKQGGDCSYGRNMTHRHEFYPQLEMLRRCRVYFTVSPAHRQSPDDAVRHARTVCHFVFEDSDGRFTPASRALVRPRLSAYSLPSTGATCGGSRSRYGRPIPSSFSCASIHFHRMSLEAHRCARVSPFTLTRSAASP